MVQDTRVEQCHPMVWYLRLYIHSLLSRQSQDHMWYSHSPQSLVRIWLQPWKIGKINFQLYTGIPLTSNQEVKSFLVGGRANIVNSQELIREQVNKSCIFDYTLAILPMVQHKYHWYYKCFLPSLYTEINPSTEKNEPFSLIFVGCLMFRGVRMFHFSHTYTL